MSERKGQLFPSKAIPLDYKSIPDTTKWPSSMLEMIDHLVVHFASKGFNESDALKEAGDIALVLSFWAGGTMIYIPKDDSLRTAIKHNIIYQHSLHDYCDINKLAKKFDLSIQSIYKIIAAQRKLAVAKKQPSIFSTTTKNNSKI